MNFNNYFADNLRYLLKSKGKTQGWLAEKIGKDRTSIGAYVNRKSIPDQNLTIEIAHILGVSLDDLLLQDMTSEQYSHIKRPSALEFNLEGVKPDGPEVRVFDAVTKLVEEIAKVTNSELRKEMEDMRELLREGVLKKADRERLEYIYNTLKKAELSNALAKTQQKLQGNS